MPTIEVRITLGDIRGSSFLISDLALGDMPKGSTEVDLPTSGNSIAVSKGTVGDIVYVVKVAPSTS